MKKTILSVAVAGLLTAGVANAAVQPNIKAGSFFVSPSAGYYLVDNARNAKDTFAFSIGAGYNFTKAIAAQVLVTALNPDSTTSSSITYKGNLLRLEGLYRLPMYGAFQPFAVLGLGTAKIENSAHFVTDLGFGVNYYLTPKTHLSLAYRYNHQFAHGMNESEFDLGLGFNFGCMKPVVSAPAKPAAKAAPKKHYTMVLEQPKAAKKPVAKKPEVKKPPMIQGS